MYPKDIKGTGASSELTWYFKIFEKKEIAEIGIFVAVHTSEFKTDLMAKIF